MNTGWDLFCIILVTFSIIIRIYKNMNYNHLFIFDLLYILIYSFNVTNIYLISLFGVITFICICVDVKYLLKRKEKIDNEIY